MNPLVFSWPRGCAALFLLLTFVPSANADVALLLAAPYGRAGSFNPTGHVGVYLNRVCAETPTRLRRCTEGETGVVISRYNNIGSLDWLAVPLIPYLFAVEDAADVPTVATADMVLGLRDRYRRAYLLEIVPDTASGDVPKGNWLPIVGAAYDRQIMAFSISTTPSQDDAFIAVMNAKENKGRFNALFRNCADFARDVVNFFHPGAIRTNFIADLGFTTPKQNVKALVRYGARNPHVDATAYLIAQIPGSRPLSKPTRGVLEGLLKTKKYSIPLTIVQPWVPVGLAAGYIATGRFNPRRYADTTLDPLEIERRARVTIDGAGLP